MKKLVLARRFVQIFSVILFVYILWSTTYPLSGFLPPDIFFKIDPLIEIFTSISERALIPGFIFCVFMLALTLIFNRFFCGWVCPLGAVIDICGVRSKIRPISLRHLKFFILSFIAICSLVGVQIAWVFDPIVITARFVSLNLIPLTSLAADKTFIFLIRHLNFYGPLYDFYRALKISILGIQPHYFPHSLFILAVFIMICSLALITKRFWCRFICPLGALYSLVSRVSFLRRIVDECSRCKRCKNDCRMDAINEDLTDVKGECILCMDCVYSCPDNYTRFTWAKAPLKKDKNGITRKDFIFMLISSVFLLGSADNRRTLSRANVIRPPAALREDKFLDRCIRCANCTKVCITNGLQPVIFESGLAGIWTPQLVPEIGYCEYKCTLCGNVCPTGAIPKLSMEEKQKARLGLASIDHSACIPWAQNKECIVCEEHCPVSDKAIKLDRQNADAGIAARPYVDRTLCIGCGICQNKCPVRPIRAIRVMPHNSWNFVI